MKASDIPSKIVLPFAADAGGSYIRTVPVASQIGVTDGAWSFHDGSVPLNFEEIALGGVPPSGQDFNGLLNVVSAHNRWAISGAPVPWDGTFSTAISGYPKGAIVQSVSTFGKLWVCTADDNTTDPDTGGANWVDYVAWLGITAAIAAAASGGFGSGQTTQDLTASRSAGITYTNGTGKPIAIRIGVNLPGNSGSSLTVNGIIISNAWYSNAFAGTIEHSAMVGVGETYSLTLSSASILKWSEFR